MSNRKSTNPRKVIRDDTKENVAAPDPNIQKAYEEISQLRSRFDDPIPSKQGELPTDFDSDMYMLGALFNLKRQEIDVRVLQEKLLKYRATHPAPMKQDLHASNSSFVPNSQIPDPNIIYNYVPFAPQPMVDPAFLVKPEPEDRKVIQSQPIDYSTIDKKPVGGDFRERTDLIQFNQELLPSAVKEQNDETDEVEQRAEYEWEGKSIYHKMPTLAIGEYDKVLRNSHVLKVKVLEMLNSENSTNYEYNKNKSRLRASYENPKDTFGRCKNNVASRRSRQRKKYTTTLTQCSLDYDMDENFFLDKQGEWLKTLIVGLESQVLKEPAKINALNKIRLDLGWEPLR